MKQKTLEDLPPGKLVSVSGLESRRRHDADFFFFFFFFIPIRRVRPDVWLLLEIWIEGRPLRNMRQSS